MDILIVSHFGSTYSENDNDRFLYLAKSLDQKNNVEIVTSSFCHEKKIHRNQTEVSWPFKITFIEEPGYKKNVCLKRFYSHYIFGLNLYKYIKNRKKPDVIYCAVPSLTGPYLISRYCKKNKIKFIIDIQDLWPEAFKMVFDVPIIKDIIFKPFEIIANSIYRKADEIVAVSQTYIDRAMKVALFNTSLIMTGKRGQLLILLVAYSIMYIVKAETVRKGIKACLKVAALLVIAYIVGYVLYITINSDNNILYRVLKLIYDKSTSDKSSGRYELWNQAIIEIKNNFLFGIGWLNYDLKYGLGVHNTYLQVLCESGVIGLVLFILAIGTTVFHSYKLARKKFNEPINYVTSFYLIYFLMFGIVENAAINIEPLFMLFLLITAQLNYSRDFDFKDLYNNTCFRKGYKI